MKLIVLFCLLAMSRARIFPNLAGIVAYDRMTGLPEFLGAGTIVSNFWILARGSDVDKIPQAHSKNFRVKVIVGKWNLGLSGREHSIGYFTAHQLFNRSEEICRYNIGVVRVHKAMTYMNEAKPMPLSFELEHVGEGVVAGWLLQNINSIPMSSDDSSNSVNVIIYDLNTCRETLQPTLEKRFLSSIEGYILNSHFCTSPIIDNSNEIDGFSGGPLMQINPETGEYEVVGFTTDFTKLNENPVMHIMTLQHRKWMMDTMRRHS